MAQFNLTEIQQKFQESPGNTTLFDYLSFHYRQQKYWEVLVNLLTQHAQAIADNNQKDAARFLTEAGEIEFLYLHNTDKAVAHWHKALVFDAQQTQSFTALENYYLRSKNQQELLQLYQQQLSAIPKNPPIALLIKVAQYYCQLGQTKEAISLYQKAREIAPKNEVVLRQLAILLEEKSEWQRAMAVWQSLLAITTDNVMREKIVLQLAKLCENYGDLAKAITYYRRIRNPALETRILEMLEQRTTPDILANIWLEKAETSQEPTYQANLYKKLANIQSQSEVAIQFYQKAIQLTPSDTTILVRIAELFWKEKKWQEWCDYQLKIAKQLSNTNAQVNYLKQQAKLLHNQLANPPEQSAIQQLESIYCKILSLVFDRESLDSLISLYQTAKNDIALRDLLLSVLNKSHRNDRIDITYRLARLYHSKNLPNEAICHYQKVLAMQPDHVPSLDQLQALYQQQGKFVELIQVLEQKIELHPTNAAGYYQEIGEIYRDRLQQIPQAIVAFENALVHDEYSLAAIESLRALFYAQQEWQSYYYYTEKKLASIVDVQQAIGLHLELALLYAEQKQLDETEHHLQQVLQYDPVHTQALQQLRKLYESTNRYSDTIVVLEKLAMFSSSVSEIPKYYLAIARIYRDQLQNFVSAWSYFELAQQLLPSDGSILIELQQIAEKLGKISELISILKQRIFFVSAGEMPVVFALLGKLHLQQGQDEAAIRYYVSALEGQPNIAWIESLATLYEKRQQYQPHIELLEMALSLEITNEKRQQIYLQLIAIAQKLQNKKQLIHYYQKLIELANKEEWIIILSQLYEECGQWEELANIYEQKILQQDSATKYLTLQKLLNIYQQLKNFDKLKATLHEMVALQLDVATLQQLQKLCLETQDWLGLLEALEREKNIATDIPRQIQLEQQMGEIYEKELADLERAIACYQKCLAMQETSPQFYKILARLYLIQQNYRASLKMLEKQIQFTPENELKAVSYVEQARLYYEYLHEPANAEHNLLQAIGFNPQYEPAWQQLQKIYQEQQRFADLANLLEKKLALSSLDMALKIQLKLAKVYEIQLQNTAQAQKHFEQIIKNSYHEEAASSLRRIYYAKKSWDELRDLYQLGIVHTTNNDSLLISLLLGLGKLYQEQFHDPGQAVSLFVRIRKIRPTHLAAIKLLQQIYQNENRLLALAEAYLAELIIPEVPVARRICLHLRCAEIFTSENKLDLAISQYQQAVKCDPNQLFAIRGLQELYRKQNLPAELANYLLTELGIEKQESRLFAIHYELSQLYQGPLTNTQEAILHLNKAYHYHPDDIIVRKEFETILQKNSQWIQYAEYLEERLNKTQSPQHESQQKLHRELALLYEKLHLDDKAVVHWEHALNLGDMPLLEIQLIQQLYQRQPQYAIPEKLLLVYEKELSKDIPPQRIMRVYQEIGLIFYQQLQDCDKASLYFEKMLAIEPANKAATDYLSQIYLKQEKWQELVSLLIRSCYYIADAKKKEAIFYKIASIFEKKLNNLEQAMSFYQKTILTGGKNLASYQGIHRILESKKDWYGLLDVLYREISLADLTEQPMLYLKVAKIWENKIKDISQAVAVYLQMLQIHFHFETAEMVVVLLKSIKDYENLAGLLQQIITQCSDSPKKIYYLCFLGQVYAESLQKTEEAIAIYQAAFKIAPDLTILSALEQLYEKQQQWVELAKIKESKLSLTTNALQLQNLHLSLGELYQHHLFDERKAILHYERALELDPQHSYVLHCLETLYIQWGYFDSFITLVEKELIWLTDNNRCSLLLEQTAQILENRLFNTQKAIQVWERLLQIDPCNAKALTSLARLYKETQNFARLVKIYLQQITILERAANKAGIVQYCIMLGEVYLYQLHEYADAEQSFLRALSTIPGEKTALDFLDKVYTTTSDFAKLQPILTQKLDASDDVAVKIDLYYRMAEVAIKLEHPETAEPYYQAAYNLQPSATTLKSLQTVYRQTRQSKKLIDANLMLISSTTNVAEQIALYAEIATLSESVPDRIRYLETILSIDPKHIPSMAGLTSLFESQQLWPKALEVLNIWVAAEENIVEKSKVLAKRAYVYQQLQKNNLTLLDLESAFAINSEDINILVQLSDLYYRLEFWEKAKNIYERLMYWSNPEQLQTFLSLAEVYYRLGNIAEHINKPDLAVLRYLKTLELNNSHLQALQKLSQIYYNNRQWQEALLLYIKLVQHPEITPSEQVHLRLQLAVVKDNLGISEGALEGYLQVLEKNPQDITALEAVGHIFAERKDYTQAIKYLLPLLDIAHEPDLIRNTLKQLGKVYQESNSLEQAIHTYTQLLDIEPNNIDTLRKLIELNISVAQWGTADKFVTSCLQITNIPQQKAELEVLAGQIDWQGYHNEQKAYEHYSNAIRLVQNYLPAIRALIAMYSSTSQWLQVAEVYREFLLQIPDTLREQKIPILLDLAQVFLEHLGQEDSAIRTYEQLLAIVPEHNGAHTAVARLAAKNPSRATQAINEYRYLQNQDPFAPVVYHALYSLYLNEKQYDRAYLCCQALKALAQISPEQNAILEAMEPRQPNAWLDPWTLDHLVTESQRGTLYEIMAMIDPWLEKVYPPYLEEKYNIRRKETLPQDSTLPTSEIVYSTLRVLGINAISVYLTENAKILLENTQPPSLILSATIMNRFTTNQIRFILGRLLFYASRNHLMANKLTPFEYQDYVACVVESFAEPSSTPSAEHKAISKKIAYNLPRKTRKQLEERLDILTEIYQADTKVFLSALGEAANHCGLLLADSIFDACRAYLWHVHSEELRVDHFSGYPAIKDMFLFYLCDEHLKLRKDIGIAVTKWPGRM